MTNKKATNIYHDMSILVVDDDQVILHLFEVLLKDVFKTLVLASNGKDALEQFNKQSFDLILTDYKMPYLDGLELISSIRDINKTIPIILMSSSKEHNVYRQAINLNVTHSLLKPIQKDQVEKVLEKVVDSIYFYQRSKQIENNELSTLKNQKDYDNQQQKQAFLKEHQAIRNDFYYSYYKNHSNGNLWYLDGSYRPHDILSGDTYSIRCTDDNKAFFFIIDAMGKGVSASVTSIVASSYINHMIDNQQGPLDLAKLLSDFNAYIIKILLEEEVLAVVFAEIDFNAQEICISSYGMPPVLMFNDKNEIIKIKTNNLPLSKHNASFNINCHKIDTIDKMLFYSDGLVESKLDNGELYFSHLKQDFANSKSRSSFLKKLYTKVTKPDDDITLLFFQKRIPDNDKKMVSLSCESYISKVEEVSLNFHTYLKDNDVDPIHTAKLGMIFTEMMMNAYEHGNLNVSHNQKKELIKKGELADEFAKREGLYGKRLINVNYCIQAHGEGKSLTFDIKDEGEGFDTNIFKKLIFDTSSVSGRGFKIAKKMVDAIYYSPKGDHVILHKYIPKEL